MALDPITVYGDSISGNCGKVRFVCDHLGLAYRWVETSVLKAETRTPDFLRLNPTGQVPLIVLSDGRTLSQSNAIIRYLAEGSDLIPEDRFDRALMDQWMFWEQYSHETAIAVRRFHLTFLKTQIDKIDAGLQKKGDKALSVMDEHLETRRFFVAERLTLADIALVAYTRMAHEGGFDLGRWPSVSAWVSRVETCLKIAPYRTQSISQDNTA
jgi:glutathione S-transferase